MRGGRPPFRSCASATAAVEEVSSPQIAVGMFDGTTFGSSSAECMPGDLFALLTDGLIEVFNRDRDELGFDWAKGVLRSSDGQPLSAIADRLLTERARLRRSARRPDGPADSPDSSLSVGRAKITSYETQISSRPGQQPLHGSSVAQTRERPILH